ncbi:BNR repeat-containing family member [Salegentibacter salinarum]|nr:BNR repeat-containing family member [Salegentibacter salinarum]
MTIDRCCNRKFFLFLSLGCIIVLNACVSSKMAEIYVGDGWANNSVNTVIFREKAITTHKKNQFTAFYNEEGFMVLAKRKLDRSSWEIHKTRYKGNTKDAHNAISIAIDGDGFLHVSWDHHDNELRYARSKKALGLELSEKMPMTNNLEDKVSYPQFYNLKDGNLVFFYRSGHSGSGSLIANNYSTKTHNWTRLQDNLIDGEDKRNAYWQTTVDSKGTIHISWVWRESWDVATNHDIAYARSKDGGKTWEKSTGEKYELPITESSAEYAWKVPQNSSLINQTSITTDAEGNPYIASYWNEENIDATQFQVVYLEDGNWKKETTDFRKSFFNLGGGGTKSIPISRPEILIGENVRGKKVYLLFRDEERDNKVSIAGKSFFSNDKWKVDDLTDYSVGQWEPNYDKELFQIKNDLHIFLQKVIQVDGEGIAEEEATPIKILEIKNLP